MINIDSYFYKKLGLYLFAYRMQYTVQQVLELIEQEKIRQCSSCGEIKLLHKSWFSTIKTLDDGIVVLNARCKVCVNISAKKYRDDNKEQITAKNKIYREKNKEHIAAVDKTYRENNKEIIAQKKKEYQQKNRSKIAIYQCAYVKRRRAIDIEFRLKHNMSRAVNKMLKLHHASKGGQILLDRLEYTIQDLIQYLERLFPLDPKINWDNYGDYWDLDHIVPHTMFPYSSMDDDNFKKAWALDNLRPLNHVQNIKENKSRTLEAALEIKISIARSIKIET